MNNLTASMIILYLSIAFSHKSFCQTIEGSIISEFTLGGEQVEAGISTIPTSDGGILIGTNSFSNTSGNKQQSNKGQVDYWIVKLTKNNSKEWEKGLGGAGWDVLSGLQVTRDNNYLIYGESDSPISIDKTEYSVGNDIWIVKLNQKGEIIWDKTLGNKTLYNNLIIPNSENHLNSIVQTSDGGFLVTGNVTFTLENNNSPNTYSWVSKLDSYGELEWEFTTKYQANLSNYFYSVIESDYSYCFYGSTRPDVLSNNYDYWVVNVNKDGNIIFNNSFGGGQGDYLNHFSLLSTGNYLAAGTSYSNSSATKSENSKGQADYWILEFDSHGNVIWDRTIGGTNYDGLSNLLKWSGGYILTGESNSGISYDKSQPHFGGLRDIWILSLTSSGQINWDLTLGGNSLEYYGSIQQFDDSTFLFGGISYSGISGTKTSETFGNGDIWMVAIGNNGQIKWQNNLGGSSFERLYSQHILEDKTILVNSISASGISGNKTEQNQGGDDLWLIKLDGDGNIVWDKSIGGSGNDMVTPPNLIVNKDYNLITISDSPISGLKSQHFGHSDLWSIRIKGLYPECKDQIHLTSPENDYSSNIDKKTNIIQANKLNGVLRASNIIRNEGTKVLYQANVVELNTGFQSNSGTIFEAKIGGCEN